VLIISDEATVVTDEYRIKQANRQLTRDYLQHVCRAKGCSDKHNVFQLMKCSSPDCTKYVHMACFISFIMAKTAFNDLDVDVIVCNKTCYEKYMSNKEEKAYSWDNDGFNGVDDPNSSVGILIGWLTTQGNYANIYRGKNNGGKSKRKVCGIIAEYINYYNVKNKRDWKQVFNKIEHLERTFPDPYIFANKETGVGMLSSDTGTFNDIVTGKCKHYYDLEAVFGDHRATYQRQCHIRYMNLIMILMIMMIIQKRWHIKVIKLVKEN
jgi:hypothetical protein